MISRYSRYIRWTLLIPTLSACNVAPTERTERDQPAIADVALVSEVGVIGADESHSGQYLVRPLSISFRRQGNLLIADRDMQIKVFSPNGTHLYSFGRKGSGPGEFQHLFWASEIRGDSIAAFDFDLHRVSVFDPQGAFVRQYPLPVGMSITVGATSNLRILGFVLPVQRSAAAKGEWGQTPLLSFTPAAGHVRADTLIVPVWLKCKPSMVETCLPMPLETEQRRGELTVSGNYVFALTADYTDLYRFRFLDDGSEQQGATVPGLTSTDRVVGLVGARDGTAWVGIELSSTATRVWRRISFESGIAQLFGAPEGARLVAAQGDCLAFFSGTTISVHTVRGVTDGAESACTIGADSIP